MKIHKSSLALTAGFIIGGLLLPLDQASAMRAQRPMEEKIMEAPGKGGFGGMPIPPASEEKSPSAATATYIADILATRRLPTELCGRIDNPEQEAVSTLGPPPAKALRPMRRDSEVVYMAVWFKVRKKLSGDADPVAFPATGALAEALTPADDINEEFLAGIVEVNPEDFCPHPGSICLPDPPSSGPALVRLNLPEYRLSVSRLSDKVLSALRDTSSDSQYNKAETNTLSVGILSKIRKEFYCEKLAIGDFNSDGSMELAYKVRDAVTIVGRDLKPLNSSDGMGGESNIEWTDGSLSERDRKLSEKFVIDGYLILGKGKAIVPGLKAVRGADLDGDGEDELFYTKNREGVSCVTPTWLTIYKQDGTLLWNHTLPTWVSCIAVGDITGDGAEEIVFSLHYTNPIVIIGKGGDSSPGGPGF